MMKFKTWSMSALEIGFYVIVSALTALVYAFIKGSDFKMSIGFGVFVFLMTILFSALFGILRVNFKNKT